MKFSALVVALATLAEAKKPTGISKNAIQAKLNGANARSFLKRARKLEEAAEEADAEANQYYQYEQAEEFVLDGTYSMQFKQCISYEVDDGQGNDEYAAFNDYVLFNMVKNGNVGAVYAIPVAEFVTDMGSMVYTQHASYCEACADAQCGEDAYEYDWNVEDGEERKLSSGVEVVDCDVCATHCAEQDAVYYDEEQGQMCAVEEEEEDGEEGEDRRRRTEDENGEIDDESAWGFVSDIVGCQEIAQGEDRNKNYNQNSYKQSYYQMQQEQEQYEEEQREQGDYYDDGSLYMGVKCNTAGDGIDLAFFIDNDCTIMDVSGHRSVTNSISYNSVAFASFMHMRTLVKGIFSGDALSCEDVEFSSGYNNYYNNDAEEEDAVEEEDNNYNYNGYPAANGYCQNAVYGDNSVNLNACDDDNYELCASLTALMGEENANYFEEAQEAAEEAAEEGDADAQYYYNEDYDAEELDEDGDVFGFTGNCWGDICYNKDQYANYEGCDYGNNYQSETDFGAWVNRNNNNGFFGGLVGGKGSSAWAVAGVMVSLAAIGAIAFVVLKKRSVENESLGEYMLEEPKPVDEKIV